MNEGLPGIVHIVDDDEALVDSLELLLKDAGWEVTSHHRGAQFRTALPHLAPGCVVLDRRLPDADGLDLLAEAKRARPDLAVILLTGHGDVGTAVRAMKEGAADFIEKPFQPRALVDQVGSVLALAAERHASLQVARRAIDLLQKLTPRERQVLDALIEGLPHKVAAHRLGISPRTIEIHRAHAMEKLGIKAIADAVRLVAQASKATDRDGTESDTG